MTIFATAQIVLSPDEKYLIGQSMDNKIIAYEAAASFSQSDSPSSNIQELQK